jgi:tRNA (guanine37-N1)-methyltransferase
MGAPERHSSSPTPAQAFEVLTIFPDAIEGFASTGLLGRAIRDGKISVHATDIRAFSSDKHRSVDATPYGGGAGMLMQVEPVVAALEHVEEHRGKAHRVLLTPAAPGFDQRAAERLARHDRLALVCGRYEGIDDRIRSHVDECISIGDFVLNGGEVAALVIVEAVARLREGVIGNAESARDESFAEARLEHPHYTRPVSFRGLEVPAILRSGDHDRISRWRQLASLRRTAELRPDLMRGSIYDPSLRHALAFELAWPGDGPAPRVGLRPGNSPGALRRKVQRRSSGPVVMVSVAPRADPAALSGPLLAAFLRELTSARAEDRPVEPIALVLPPGLGRPEATLAVPEEIFSLAKQAAMIDISPPPDPGPLLEELRRAFSGQEDSPS